MNFQMIKLQCPYCRAVFTEDADDIWHYITRGKKAFVQCDYCRGLTIIGGDNDTITTDTLDDEWRQEYSW